ncbi:hypothetical protein ACHAXT_004196 [Thalassiosira profunda]
MPEQNGGDGHRRGSDSVTLHQLRFPKGRLFGRDDEEKALREMYLRVKNVAAGGGEERTRGGTAKDMALVTGSTGTGKTALVESLRSRVKTDYFVSGKFNLMKRMTPYAAIVDALTALARELREEDAHRRGILRERLGPEATEVIARCVPAMKDVLMEEEGKEGDKKKKLAARRQSQKPGSTESRNQFNFAFRSLLRGICDVNGKALVLFIDDLQWADAASLELIEVLVTDKENTSLLFIGSYRQNEVSDAHPLAARLREIERSGAVDITRVSIGNLELDVINDYLSEVLNMELPRTKPLAETTFHKTHGNIFFVNQFLKMLAEGGLLNYSFGLLEWSWDLERINEMVVTDNVADLMLERLRRIPVDERQVLSVSSCLGASFDLAVVVLVVDFLHELLAQDASTTHEVKKALSFISLTAENIEPSIDKDLSNGLLELAFLFREDAYRFCHDQIQQAAFALIPAESRNVFQYVVGRALVDKLTSEQLADVLFGAVDLLNSGVEDYMSSTEDNSEELFQLAQLNLSAGKKALEISAFRQSAAYLKTSIDLMQSACGGEEAAWTQQHDYCIEAFQARADSLYCVGEIDASHEICTQILERASTEARMAALSTMVTGFASQNRFVESFDTGFRAMSELGESIPRHPGKATIVLELLQTKRFMKKYPLERIRSLPAMNDPSRETLMKILTGLIVHAQLEYPNLLPLIAFRLLRWSCMYGLSSSSPAAFATYALIVSSGLGDLKGGYEYAMLAMDLVEKSSDKSAYCFTATIASITRQTQEPCRSVIKNDLFSYQVGMEQGTVFDAMVALSKMLVTETHAGRPLFIVESDMSKYVPHFKEYAQMHCHTRILPCWQFVLTLTDGTASSDGDYSNSSVLTGEVMNEEDYLDQMKEFPGQVALTLVYKQVLLYLLGDMDEAAKLSDKTHGFTEKYGKALFFGIRYTFFNGLTACVMLQQRKGSKRKWQKRKKASLKKMVAWKKKGNVNVSHMLALLQAEDYSLQKKMDVKTARSKYDAAISMAARAGFANDSALANERAGACCSSKGDSYWAGVYLSRAHKCWAEYGALAICGRLAARYPEYITDDVKKTSLRAYELAMARVHKSSLTRSQTKGTVFRDATERWASLKTSNIGGSRRRSDGSHDHASSLGSDQGYSRTLSSGLESLPEKK